MNELKFTPGPWRVAGERESRMVTSENLESGVICDVWGNSEAQEANAHLIAAAPEMYDWIESTVESAKMWLECGSEMNKNKSEALKIIIETGSLLLRKARR